MALVVVGTEPVLLGHGSLLLQNLGEADIYVGGSDVSDENGVLIEGGGLVSIGLASGRIYAVADEETELRVQPGGSMATAETAYRAETAQVLAESARDVALVARNGAEAARDEAVVAADSMVTIWKGTQAAYDALGSYDDNTLYLVIP